MLRMLSKVSPTEILVCIFADDHTSIGTAYCGSISQKEMYFNRLYVDPKFRNRGFGTKLLKKVLEAIKERHLVLRLDINPYGDMDYDQLKQWYEKYGFKGYTVDGDFYTHYFNKEEKEMDINENIIDEKYVAIVINEQTFWIGDNANVEVLVNLYEHNGTYKMTSWLNGTEELNTIDYEGAVDNPEEILSAMEKLINDNEDYILDIASWDSE